MALVTSLKFTLVQIKIHPVPNPNPKGKTYDLVMRLMQPYLNAGCCLYVDNYYTSPTLFNYLYKLNTGTCGTARYRKGIPHAFQTAQGNNKGDKFVMNKLGNFAGSKDQR